MSINNKEIKAIANSLGFPTNRRDAAGTLPQVNSASPTARATGSSQELTSSLLARQPVMRESRIQADGYGMELPLVFLENDPLVGIQNYWRKETKTVATHKSGKVQVLKNTTAGMESSEHEMLTAEEFAQAIAGDEMNSSESR